VTQASHASSSVEPPSSVRLEAVYPARAFGHGTARYRAFVEALAEGLAECEAVGTWRRRGGGGGDGDPATPVPAA